MQEKNFIKMNKEFTKSYEELMKELFIEIQKMYHPVDIYKFIKIEYRCQSNYESHLINLKTNLDFNGFYEDYFKLNQNNSENFNM